MVRQAWDCYWESIEQCFIERQIQKYKYQRGYPKLLQAIPELPARGRVLEVGAGKAWISRLLRARGWHTIAIDLSSDIATSNAKSVDSYVIGDMFNLPFKKKSFDLVMSCGLIEHFDLDVVRKIFTEMKRVGRSIIAWFPTCGVTWKMVWKMRNMLGGNVYSEAYEHQKQDVNKMLSSLGFDDVKSGVVSIGKIFRIIYIYAR